MGVMLDAPWNGVVFAPPTAIDIATIEDAIRDSAAFANQLDRNHTLPRSSRNLAHDASRRRGARDVQRCGIRRAARHRGDNPGTQTRVRGLGDDARPRMGGRRRRGGAESGRVLDYRGNPRSADRLSSSRLPQDVPGAREIHKTRQAGRRLDLLFDLALSTVAVEGSPTENFPTLHQSNALEEGGQTTITVGASAYTFNSNGPVQLPQGNVFCGERHERRRRSVDPGYGFLDDRANGIVIAIPAVR